MYLGQSNSHVVLLINIRHVLSTWFLRRKHYFRFLLYLPGKCLDLHKIFRERLRRIKYFIVVKVKYLSRLRVFSEHSVVYPSRYILPQAYKEHFIRFLADVNYLISKLIIFLGY